MDDKTYQSAWKRFYVAESRPDEGTGWLRGTNLVLMTSSGRLLQGHLEDRNNLAAALEKVVAAYKKLPAHQRRANSVEGEIKPQQPPPEGGLVLTIYDRLVGRDDRGEYRLPEGDDLGELRTEAPHGQRSSLWLMKEECQSLIPPQPKQGETHDVDEKLAQRIWLYGLEESGIPHCYNLQTGEEVWQIAKRPGGGNTWGSIVYADGRLYVLMRNATTLVFAAKPEYELLADNRLRGESTNSSVVFANGDLYIRTFKHLWCFGKVQ